MKILKKTLLVILALFVVIVLIIRHENIAEHESKMKKLDTLLKQDSIDSVNTKINNDLNYGYVRTHINKLVRIKCHVSPPNTAGGIDVEMSFKNLSDKTIKYITWGGYFINAVNDKIQNEVGDDNIECKFTGPLKPDKAKSTYWENVFYNSTAKKLKIDYIEIQYMNGFKVEIEDNTFLRKIGIKN